MPAVKTDTVKRAIAEFERWEREAVSTHCISSGDIRAEFTLIIRSARDGNDVRETATGNREGEGESAYHAFATNISPGAAASDPDRFV